jgi:hypothetical protein
VAPRSGQRKHFRLAGESAVNANEARRSARVTVPRAAMLRHPDKSDRPREQKRAQQVFALLFEQALFGGVFGCRVVAETLRPESLVSRPIKPAVFEQHPRYAGCVGLGPGDGERRHVRELAEPSLSKSQPAFRDAIGGREHPRARPGAGRAFDRRAFTVLCPSSQSIRHEQVPCAQAERKQFLPHRGIVDEHFSCGRGSAGDLRSCASAWCEARRARLRRTCRRSGTSVRTGRAARPAPALRRPARGRGGASSRTSRARNFRARTR